MGPIDSVERMTVALDYESPAKIAKPSGYLPYLDGLRGLAIVLVLWFHADSPYFKGGFIGVDIFFVLSGFLITSLLIKEWDRKGRISLPHFYARRALRLLPAVVVMLAVYVAFVGVFHREYVKVVAENALIVLFYSANWFRAYGRNLHGIGHCWSLSIEEQFYLVWPVLFVGLIRLKRRWLGWVVLGLAIASAGLRAGLWWNGVGIGRLYDGLDTRADSLLIGCAMAFFLDGVDPERPSRRAERVMAHAACAFLLIGAFVMWYSNPVMIVAGYFGVAAAAAILVWDLRTRPRTVLRAITQWPPLVKLGRISYGVYLWHYPIYHALLELRTRMGWHVRWPLYLFVGGGIAIGVASLSYWLIELPFLKLKRKFQ